MQKKERFSGDVNLYARVMTDCFSAEGERDKIPETAAERLAEAFLRDKKGRILRIAAADSLSQAELDEELTGIDLETLRGGDALLLAHAKQRHRGLDFGRENEPRLCGLIQHRRFGNLNQLSFFSEITGRVNRAGIIPLASYDIAMKYYMPESCRFFDAPGVIAATEEQYAAIRKELAGAGYRISGNEDCFEAAPAEEKTGKECRVFRGTVLASPDSVIFPEKVMGRGTVRELFHARCCVPSAEDMVLITVSRIWSGLRDGRNFQGVAYDIWDLCCLIRGHGISRDVLKERVSGNGILFWRYRFAERFVNGAIPGLLPEVTAGEAESGPALRKFLREEKKHIAWRYDRKSIRYFVRRCILKTGLPARAPRLVSAWRAIRRHLP